MVPGCGTGARRPRPPDLRLAEVLSLRGRMQTLEAELVDVRAELKEVRTWPEDASCRCGWLSRASLGAPARSKPADVRQKTPMPSPAPCRRLKESFKNWIILGGCWSSSCG